jgi:hypothetical protein
MESIPWNVFHRWSFKEAICSALLVPTFLLFPLVLKQLPPIEKPGMEFAFAILTSCKVEIGRQVSKGRSRMLQVMARA